MWHHLRIRTQLIVFVISIISLIEVATLISVYLIQSNDNKLSAIKEAKSLAKSLNNDFLSVILNPNTAQFADITYRLSAFENINGVVLYNQSEAIYEYGETINKKGIQEAVFTDNTLVISEDIVAEETLFGHTVFEIDLEEYFKKQENITMVNLFIFFIMVLIGITATYLLSRTYTQPFLILLHAMKKSDPTHNLIERVQTPAQNEIRELFNGYNIMMQDIATASHKLQHQASHDQLTNIYNRFYLEEAIEASLRDESGIHYTLLNIDIDQFKLINDTAGYQAGDEFLKIITSEYQQTLPKNSLFARVDGDSFMVLLQKVSVADSIKFLNKSLAVLSDVRFVHEGEAHSVSASIGMVMYKPYEYTLKELLKAANSSLYGAKLKGRNKSYIYDKTDDMTIRYDKESLVAINIKEALYGGEARFELYAQAIVPLQYESDKISYEILIRMWDKKGNFVPPDSFLPTAVRYQLMSEIDIYVLWNYLESVIENKHHLEKLHTVHINLAGSTLVHPDFQAKLQEAVERFDFPWEKLEFEVTETSAVGNFNKANELITWMKGVGIGLALDDFGTGMASFEYLKSLPFDVVKIDGSFIRDMHTDPSDKAVIKYIQEISALRGQETVAEYVETLEDIQTLKSLGIDYGQGYYLGKPQPLSRWLED